MLKIKISIINIIIIFVMTGCNISPEITPTLHTFDNNWVLTFEDNFDTLDLNNWKINTMPNDDPLVNGTRRAGYYTDDSDIIYTANGNLYISTKYKSGIYGEGWYSGFLESSINTGDELTSNPNYRGFSQQYGYFEIRCITPPSVGIWSAFWLMPDNYDAFSENDIQWTAADGAEIDIMESPYYYKFFNKELTAHAIHADSYGIGLKSLGSETFSVDNMYTDFHKYAIEWNETEYIIYIDNVETWRTTQEIFDSELNELRDLGVSKVNEYIILSVEVAGSRENGIMYPGYIKNDDGDFQKFWCGDPSKNDLTKSYDFIIDYVKVYQKR